MTNKQEFTLEPEQFFEFEEDKVWVTFSNCGKTPKTIKLELSDVKKSVRRLKGK